MFLKKFLILQIFGSFFPSILFLVYQIVLQFNFFFAEQIFIIIDKNLNNRSKMTFLSFLQNALQGKVFSDQKILFAPMARRDQDSSSL